VSGLRTHLAVVVLALGTAALGACATGGAVGGGGTVPTAARAETLARTAGADGVTAERWHQGENLFSSRCQRCHALPNPASVTPEKWPTEVQEMSRKSGLSGDQTTLVAEYLVAAAKATRSAH
jgi:hypothetical protein